MMTLEKCPTSDELKSLSLGQLPEDQSDNIFGHVQGCRDCQAELETEEAIDDTLVRMLRVPGPNEDSNFTGEAEYQTAMTKAIETLGPQNNISLDDSELSQLIPKVLGDYEIVHSIGRGGMGNVYLARHQKLGREVALKVLLSNRLLQPRMRKRFETEMRAVGQLSHPNIVTAFDAREVDDLAVLVTEYIDGLDVAQILRRTGKLPVAEACTIAQRIAEALDYINQQGLVHRDIKPSNVIVSRTGEVKLLDLGLARLNLNDDHSLEMTATGQAMGTADYVAPEQVNDSRHVDIRADIYALGCTLYKMLAGQSPFPNDQYPTTFAKMTAHVSESPTPLTEVAPEVPEILANLVHQMMAKNPNDRLDSPNAVAETVEQFTHTSDLSTLVAKTESVAALNREKPTMLHAMPHAMPNVAKPVPKPFLSKRGAMMTAVGAGLVGTTLGLLLGVVVLFKSPDGTETAIELPEGAKLRIGADGNAEAMVAREAIEPIKDFAKLLTELDKDRVELKSDTLREAVEKQTKISDHLTRFSEKSLPAIDLLLNYVFMRNETSPRLQGRRIRVGLGETYKNISDAIPHIKPGDCIDIGEGKFDFDFSTFGEKAPPADLAFSGKGVGKTEIQLSPSGTIKQATRWRLANMTIHCGDNEVAYLRSGGSMEFQNCLIREYNSGAGGSNAIGGSNVVMVVENSVMEGDSGRQAGRSLGDAFDLRGQNLLYVRETTFESNAEIARAVFPCVFDECNSTGRGQHWQSNHLYKYPTGTVIVRKNGIENLQGTYQEFDFRVDQTQFVELASGIREGELDARATRMMDRVRLDRHPGYWIGLIRSRDREIRALAIKRVESLLPVEVQLDSDIPIASEEVTNLIDQLDAKTFKERKDASEQLVNIGLPASSALVNILNDGSIEQQKTAAKLLKIIGFSIDLGVDTEVGRLLNWYDENRKDLKWNEKKQTYK